MNDFIINKKYILYKKKLKKGREYKTHVLILMFRLHTPLSLSIHEEYT